MAQNFLDLVQFFFLENLAKSYIGTPLYGEPWIRPYYGDKMAKIKWEEVTKFLFS